MFGLNWLLKPLAEADSTRIQTENNSILTIKSLGKYLPCGVGVTFYQQEIKALIKMGDAVKTFPTGQRATTVLKNGNKLHITKNSDNTLNIEIETY